MTLWPGEREATGVFRQRRSCAYAAGTLMSVVPELTTNFWPVRALDGLPPSPGGEKRGSSQVPVHVGGYFGFCGESKWVSL